MTPDEETAGAPQGDAFTGSGAPLDAVDSEVTTEESADDATVEEVADVPDYPEPVSHGLVRQDGVTEPGVQTTSAPGIKEDGSIGMVESRHGEPISDESAEDEEPDAEDE